MALIEPSISLAGPAEQSPTDAAPKRLVVDAQNISLTFETADGKVDALSNVGLQVTEGEFVSFIGPSGCGKTTMPRVIADLQQPTSGTLLVNGMSAEEARQRAGKAPTRGAVPNTESEDAPSHATPAELSTSSLAATAPPPTLCG